MRSRGRYTAGYELDERQVCRLGRGDELMANRCAGGPELGAREDEPRPRQHTHIDTQGSTGNTRKGKKHKETLGNNSGTAMVNLSYVKFCFFLIAKVETSVLYKL